MSTEEGIPTTPKQEEKTIDIVEPTYIIKPDETEKFYPSQAQKIASEVMEEEFNKIKVDEKWIEDWADFGDEFEDLSKDLCDKIKARCLQELTIPRYKVVVQVTIGQRKDQGVRVTSRCLWDTSTDNYACANYQNEHLWVNALVFGMYTN